MYSSLVNFPSLSYNPSPTAPEDLEASMSAAIPVLLGAGWRHPLSDRACAALGAASGQPLPRGNLRRNLRPPASTHLSAREGERHKKAWGEVVLEAHLLCTLN